MDLQKQQTGIVQTNNPQPVSQPNLTPTTTNLQQTSSTDVNQLTATSLSVTATCTTSCSGSIPAQTTSVTTTNSSSAWVIILVGVVVALVVGWMFRQLSGSK